jgi:hypothetical protein
VVSKVRVFLDAAALVTDGGARATLHCVGRLLQAILDPTAKLRGGAVKDDTR